MTDTITIKFRGICTHLIPNNTWIDCAPKLDLFTEDGRVVKHRVFLANPELIGEIDKEKKVPAHHATICLEDRMMTPEAQKYLPAVRKLDGSTCWEAPLPRVGLEFEGVSVADGVIEDSFKELPSVWHWTPDPHPKPKARPEALNGFADHAQVYIDLFTGFRIARIDNSYEVAVTLTFDRQPVLIWKPNNKTFPGSAIVLNPGTIEISNVPKKGECSPYDYLLHYFPTTTRLDKNPPEWPILPGPCRDKAEALAANEPPSPDVYCSSSGYP